ncbi:MAG: MoxR family ATPase [Armatimonadetes bacterium]|nr:MoxR family ATPase [Armatimonadota bacterium]
MTDPNPPLTEAPGPADRIAAFAEALAVEAGKVIVGQPAMLEQLTVALLAGGHVLLEGVPGTAKTLTVRVLARLCRVSFSRIQFTPDLMPSDVLGTNVFSPKDGTFTVRQGPIFAALVLADEINRTPPKTQSALLEAMEERQATIDGVPFALPRPFMVCATQNPVEFEGTYPLPEAQLDRFSLRIDVGYPGLAEEEAILARYEAGFRAVDLDAADLRPVADAEALASLQADVAAISVTEPVRAYIVAVTRAAREHRHVVLGPSPRAAVTLLLTAKALAGVRGRPFVTPDDVKDLALPVFRHRILLKPDSEIEGETPDRVLKAILATVPVPR